MLLSPLIFDMFYYGGTAAEEQSAGAGLEALCVRRDLSSAAPLAVPTMRMLPPCLHLQTRLSLNGGGDWQPLSRPERFTNPQCNTCKAGAPDHQCRLHLHGPTSWFAPEGEPSALSSPANLF